MSPSRALRIAARILAFVLLLLLFGVHKGYNDISRIADKHSGQEFWREVGRYVIGNLAGGAKKQE
jgi:hypothetical protein